MYKRAIFFMPIWFILLALHSQADNKWVVEEVVVRGNTWTKKDIVLRELGIRPEEALEEEELLDRLLSGKDRLERSGLFTEVFLDQEIVEEGKIKIIVEVEERWNVEIAPGGSYYLNEKGESRARGFLHVRDRNFLGYGQELDLRVHYIADYGFEANWMEPYLVSSSWNLELGAVYLLGSYQDQVDRLGGALGLGYSFAPDLKGGSTYRYQSVNPRGGQTRSTLAGLNPYLKWGHADRPNPKERFWNLLVLESEVDSRFLGGSEDYVKLKTSYSLFRDLLLRIVAAISLSAGVGYGNIPTYELFTNQVRGWDTYDMTGDLSLNLDSELRIPIPLYEFLQVVLFLDAGALGGKDKLSLVGTAVGGGVGLRWFNVVQNPLRLDIAWGNGLKLHLGLDQSF